MKNTIFSEPTIQSSKQREMKGEGKNPLALTYTKRVKERALKYWEP